MTPLIDVIVVLLSFSFITRPNQTHAVKIDTRCRRRPFCAAAAAECSTLR